MADQGESSAAAAAAPTLTQRDMEILVSAFKCLTNDPLEIDLNDFMLATGLKSAGSARNAWAAIKKKVLIDGAVPTAPATSAAPKTPKTPRKTGTDASTKTPSKKTAAGEAKSKLGIKSGEEIKAEAPSRDAEDDEAHDSGHEDTTTAKGGTDAPTKTEVKDEDHDRMESTKPDAVPVNANALKISQAPVTSPPSTPTPVKKKVAKAAPLSKKAVAIPGGSDQVTTSADSNGAVAKDVTGDDASADEETLPPMPAVTPGGTKKRSRKPNVEPADDAEADDSDEAAKPVKKARKQPVKKAVKKDETNDDEGDGDEDLGDGDTRAKTPATKKPRAPRTPKDPNAPPKKIGRPPGSRNKTTSTDTTKTATKAKKNTIGQDVGEDQNEEDIMKMAQDAAEVLVKKQKTAAPAKNLVPVVVVPEMIQDDRVAKNSIDAKNMVGSNDAKETADEEEDLDTIESRPEITNGNDADTEMTEADMNEKFLTWGSG